jgi:predicted Zn-dependent protease
MRSGRYDDAARAALAQLGHQTSDTDLWRTLAYAEQERGDRTSELAALEAASISAPADQGLRLRLGQVQLSEGLPQAALATARKILGDHPQPAQVADLTLMTFAVRAAAAADELSTARAWLAGIPDAKRDRSLRLLEAHVDLEAEDYAAAEQALARLIALGENDPGILVWAASISEKIGDAPRAEALYEQASLGQGVEAENAGLRLAVLYYRHQRYSDAQVLVATYLAKHPGDPSATALRTIIDTRLAAHAKTVQ